MFETNQANTAFKYVNRARNLNPIVGAALIILVLIAIPVILALFFVGAVISSIVKSIRSIFYGVQQPIQNNDEPQIIINNSTNQKHATGSHNAEYVEYEIVED